MRSTLLAILVLGLAAGCQTQFVGDPHIDPATCQAKCTEAHLVMAGMVYMGQYSSACLCEVAPAGPPPGATPPGGAPGGVARASGSLGAVAGVVMQMRANEAQWQQSTLPSATGPHR